ncbi:MAG TPA: hypothetical protein VGN23_09370 [Verrucomicrobiae bacterium]|jgi:hypothetical protein
MPYRYTPPGSVISPQDCVSNIRVIFDGGTGSSPFSVVKLDWSGVPRIAMRWNVSEREWDDADKISGKVVCKGMPVSRGHPVWFVLPDEVASDSDVWKDIKHKLKGFGRE